MTTTWSEILSRLPGPGGWGWGSDGQYRLLSRSVTSSSCLEHWDLQSTSTASWRSSRCRRRLPIIPIPMQLGSIILHMQQPTKVLIRTTRVSGGGITISASMILTPRQIYGAINESSTAFHCPATLLVAHLTTQHQRSDAICIPIIHLARPWESLGCPEEIWSEISHKFIVMWEWSTYWSYLTVTCNNCL